MLNIDDERLTGLVDDVILQEIKNETNLKQFTLSKAASVLLAKVGECVPSSRKLRSTIRKSIGKSEDFDLIDMFDVNFIETLAFH